MKEDIIQVEVGGGVHDCKVVRKAFIRNITLRVDAKKGIRVTAPRLASLDSVKRFVFAKELWIAQHMEKFSARNGLKKRVVNGEVFTLLGEEYVLKIVEGVRRRPQAAAHFSHSTRELVLTAHASSTHASHVKALQKAYIDFAKSYITDRVDAINDSYYHYSINEIRIKSQSTRFGSCSSKRNLNFNWRLILTDPRAIDYVVAHELSHLEQMNHSQAFWKLVGKAIPDYANWKKFLKEQHSMLELDFA